MTARFRPISSARAHLGSSAIPTSKTTRFVVRQWSGAHDIRRLAIRFRKLLIYKEMTSWAARSALVEGQKNDFRDAEAIAEAVQRPTMKFVATKTADQLDLQALHRVRERLVGQRTSIINQIRAFLLERGIAVRRQPLSCTISANSL
jgi:hypothetical protein